MWEYKIEVFKLPYEETIGGPIPSVPLYLDDGWEIETSTLIADWRLFCVLRRKRGAPIKKEGRSA
jgi:hypothetical protein